MKGGFKMTSVSKRLKEALDMRGMKQTDLVKATGIGKSSISTYLSGDYEPKQRNIYKIAKALNVNEAWLMGYDVPPERTPFPKDALFQTISTMSETLDKLPFNAIESLDTNECGYTYDLVIEKLKPAENSGLEENVVIYHRNGKTEHLKLSKEKMDMFVKMIEAFKDDDVDL
jgi:transcriptional regulator with XRE-family HTH domain